VFFSGDGIEYEFQHDDLHEAVKFMDVPAYTLYAGGEVWSDMNKFKQCSREVQLYGILEEALLQQNVVNFVLLLVPILIGVLSTHFPR
jgi:hypothetical protein